DDGAQAPADEALNLERAAALRSARSLALSAAVRRARQHAVLGRHPALPLALQERRDLRLYGSRAEDACVTELGEHRSFGMAREVRGQPHLAHLIAPASARPHEELRSKRGVANSLPARFSPSRHPKA